MPESLLMRLGAICALSALMDALVDEMRLKSSVRLIGAILIMLAMMDLARAAMAADGWQF